MKIRRFTDNFWTVYFIENIHGVWRWDDLCKIWVAPALPVRAWYYNHLKELAVVSPLELLLKVGTSLRQAEQMSVVNVSTTIFREGEQGDCSYSLQGAKN